MMRRRVAGGSKINLPLTPGNFLLNNGMEIIPINVNDNNRNNVIGYILDDSGDYSGKYIIMPINSSSVYMSWSLDSGPGYTDIHGLTNYEYNIGSTEPYEDKNGKSNTKIIVDYVNSQGGNIENDVPATNYCINFSPGFKDGEWYLPSMGELKLFYDNREKFRENCKIAGISTNMNSDDTGAYYFWSSTQYSDRRAWFLTFYSYDHSRSYDKINYIYIIPFLVIN